MISSYKNPDKNNEHHRYGVSMPYIMPHSKEYQTIISFFAD